MGFLTVEVSTSCSLLHRSI